MELKATEVQLASQVGKTSPEILCRYQQNRNWRYFPKEWIYRNIPFHGKEVLDFGCGTGEITTQLALLGARKVYGMDVTQGLLDQTRQRAEYDGVTDKCELICGFVQDIEPRPVDVIIAFAVLHHCFPLENVIPKLLRWLKPGGVFVAVEPVVYIQLLEWLRNRSGIERDPLDEGERKLNPDDVRYIIGHLSEAKVIPFRIIRRLSRMLPAADPTLCLVDRAILQVPGAWKLSGTALITGVQP